jgi:hypothetical protein
MEMFQQKHGMTYVEVAAIISTLVALLRKARNVEQRTVNTTTRPRRILSE